MRSQVRQIYLKEPDFRIYELIIPSAVDRSLYRAV